MHVRTHLLVGDEHAGVVVLAQQALLVVDKLGADVAAVNVHTLLHLHHSIRAAEVQK